ncbi:hypothetical protein MPLA_620006 [Mesorhizobium sp. ORS 3359]|nr:hypothetical protein MPLA_620006 [Mesorhizobium sp. ORS 3359]
MTRSSGVIQTRAFIESAGADAGILNLAKGLVGAVRDTDPGVSHRRGFFILSHRRFS